MTETETETDQQPEEPALELDAQEDSELSWDNMKGELETNYAEIKDNIKKWKTKAKVSTRQKKINFCYN